MAHQQPQTNPDRDMTGIIKVGVPLAPKMLHSHVSNTRPARGASLSFSFAFRKIPFAAFLSGILAVAADVYSTIYFDSGGKYDGDLISTPVAFALGKITGRYVLPCTLLRFIVGILLLFILLIYTYRRRHLSGYESIEDFIRLYDLHPIRYSYKELKSVTKGFNKKIGEGGFGTVYKGKLRSGSELQSKCWANPKLLARNLSMKWQLSEGYTISICYCKIYEISLGVACGRAYLHHGYDMQILHFDIKPHNILLDDNLNPKILDFGLGRLYFTNDSIATLSLTRGTIGYMAPELFYKNIGKVSYKADVYGFGMLLMEMASRRRNMNPHVEHSSQVYFPSWIHDQFVEEKDIEMDYLTEEEKVLAKKMFTVAL
ncbi:rust resistance kinase Lr10-like [Neltuma alba]|uniref:rust resistance kinase Lr10-like n=1 Tax=Neltuma alba TaxID=207710 RepID=UPI0010A3A178|nr:rust resistance kinase Lr10-like [Prosopis alba]